MNQLERAAALRQLHSQRPLILPNAWDAGSARAIELAGAAAIASTSSGVAWSYGYADGQQISREMMLQAIGAIVRVVNVPVTADIEGGYGIGSPDDVAETVRGVIKIGAAGINLEDSPGQHGQPLLTAEAHAARIRAARESAQALGGDLVINARTDVYLNEVGAPETRFAEAVRRANIYRQAGADCLFVPGVIDAATIKALAEAIDGPLNILAEPGAPAIAELGRLGVARVSLGPGLAQAALAITQRAAYELLREGTYHALEQGLGFEAIQDMFAR